MLIAEYASKNGLLPYIPKDKVQQELQDLYHCLQNLKYQLNQTHNYLENKDHLSSLVCNSYNQLAQHIIQEIRTVELAINSLIAHNNNIRQKVDNIQTIPGIDKLTAIAILAEYPDLDSFNNARELAAYAVLTPKHRISGTSIKGKSLISKTGSAKLCKALYFPAIGAKNHNPIFTNFVRKQSSKGKPAKVIIVAIMRKLLNIVFGVIKNKSPFNHNLILDY